MKKIYFLVFLFLCANLLSAQTTSEYCDYVFDPPVGNNTVATSEDAAKFTWVTLPNGTVQISIAPNDPVNYPDVAFRNNGINSIANVTVNGVGNQFTLAINAAKTVVTLTPIQPIAAGAVIAYAGTLEYRTATTAGTVGGNLSDLWPAAPFTGYTYGYDCDGPVSLLTLAAPANVAMSGSNITFSPVINATNYIAYIYSGTTELFTQSISGSGATLNFPFSGNFSVKVQALDNTGIYTNSELSAAAAWVIALPDAAIGNSSVCHELFDPALGNGYGVEGDEDAAYFTIETEATGEIVFSIEGFATPATTAFRANGININNLTIGGIAASSIVTKTADAEMTMQIFTPKSGVTIPRGTAVEYSGFVEYRVVESGSEGELDNLYPTRSFSYVYGSTCPSGPVTGLTETTDLQIAVFPNPVENILYVNGEYQSVELVDITGKAIAQYRNQSGIDVSNLAKGIYLIKIETDNGSVVKKIVKR